jgi:SAM-dependent methyltransferase
MLKSIDIDFWDSLYLADNTGWDLGQVSPPIKEYFDNIVDKDAAILIPGCGNAYEASYLLDIGFTNITVIDIAPTLVKKLKEEFKNNDNIKVILGDFFELNTSFDYIIEQTFFCALPPNFRDKYVQKTHQLLNKNGKLIGLLFNTKFENNPPFGGDIDEYKNLFQTKFKLSKLEPCKNSIKPRMNTELFIEFIKK